MSDLGAIHERVPFDWEAADALIAQFNAAATRLRAQGSRRNPLASTARKDWRGVYATKFDARMKVCLTDAGHLADAMTKAANEVKQLAKAAREEQKRRDIAKQYEVELAAWQAKRDRRGEGEKVWDAISEHLGGSDDKPRPPHGPKSPPVLPLNPPTLGTRD